MFPPPVSAPVAVALFQYGSVLFPRQSDRPPAETHSNSPHNSPAPPHTPTAKIIHDPNCPNSSPLPSHLLVLSTTQDIAGDTQPPALDRPADKTHFPNYLMHFSPPVGGQSSPLRQAVLGVPLSPYSNLHKPHKPSPNFLAPPPHFGDRLSPSRSPIAHSKPQSPPHTAANSNEQFRCSPVP